MEKISVYNIVKEFNRSEMKKAIIPQEMVSGWPNIKLMGKTLCVTIPYYGRIPAKGKFYLKPIYCSVTIPVGNPEKIMDFTIYPYQKGWEKLDYSKPVGCFKHEALNDVKTKGEYQALTMKLYDYFDLMVEAVLEKKPFEQESEMEKLYSKLMEPGHYSQYLKINKKFYGCMCEL